MQLLFSALSEHTRIPPTRLAVAIADDRAFLGRLARGGNFTFDTYDKIVQRFSAVWPATVPWPEQVPRQAPAEGMEEHAEEVGRRAWPADIPVPQE